MSNQSNRQICEALHTDMFRQSFIYRFQKFIQSPDGIKFFKIKQSDRPKSTWRFDPVLKKDIIKEMMKNQGFQFEEPEIEDDTNFGSLMLMRIYGYYNIKHRQINSQTSQQEARQIWLENIKSNFGRKQKSFTAKLFYLIEKKSAVWNEQGNAIIIKDRTILNHHKKIKHFTDLGFSAKWNSPRQTELQYSHEFLRRNSPIEVWIWIQQFWRMNYIQTKNTDKKKPRIEGNIAQEEELLKSQGKQQIETIKQGRTLLAIQRIRQYLKARFNQSALVQAQPQPAPLVYYYYVHPQIQLQWAYQQAVYEQFRLMYENYYRIYQYNQALQTWYMAGTRDQNQGEQQDNP